MAHDQHVAWRIKQCRQHGLDPAGNIQNALTARRWVEIHPTLPFVISFAKFFAEFALQAALEFTKVKFHQSRIDLKCWIRSIHQYLCGLPGSAQRRAHHALKHDVPTSNQLRKRSGLLSSRLVERNIGTRLPTTNPIPICLPVTGKI